MNVMFINSWGIRKSKKRKWIKDLCFQHGVIFLRVQETIMTRLNIFKIKSMWGNFKFYYACSLVNGRSAGIVSVWDLTVFIKEHVVSYNDFLIVEGR